MTQRWWKGTRKEAPGGREGFRYHTNVRVRCCQTAYVSKTGGGTVQLFVRVTDPRVDQQLVGRVGAPDRAPSQAPVEESLGHLRYR